MNKTFNYTIFAVAAVALNLFIIILSNVLWRMEWSQNFLLDFYSLHLLSKIFFSAIYTGLISIFYLKFNLETKFGTMLNSIALICVMVAAFDVIFYFGHFVLYFLPYSELLISLVYFVSYDYFEASITLFSLGIFLARPRSNILKYLAISVFAFGVIDIMLEFITNVMYLILTYEFMPEGIYTISKINGMILLILHVAFFGYMYYRKIGPKELQPDTI